MCTGRVVFARAWVCAVRDASVVLHLSVSAPRRPKCARRRGNPQEPTKPEPFWLRYALELWQIDRRPEALGIARRVANKFDLEPEAALAVSSMLYADGVQVGM